HFARLSGHRRAAAAAPREPADRRDFGGDEPAARRCLARVFFLVDRGALHGGNFAPLPRALEPGRAQVMRPYYFTVLVLGIAMAFGILYLVRRDHLYIRQGLFWIAVAAISLLFGSWPVLIDAIRRLLG